MNYYDEIIEKIETLISQGQYLEAKVILNEELSMPYIEKKYEDIFRSLDTQIRQYFHSFESFDASMVQEYLKGDLQTQLKCLNYLAKYNLNDYILEISDYLKTNKLKETNVMMILLLIKQGINHEFKVSLANQEHTFNPSQIEEPRKQELYGLCLTQFSALFENDHTDIYRFCLETLELLLICKLPETYACHQAQTISDSIIYYVLKAMGLESTFQNYQTPYEKMLDIQKLIQP